MIERSSVVGRDGLVLADLGREIGLLIYDLNLEEKRVTQFFFNEKHDRTLAVMASRRPEIYGELVKDEARKKALKKIASRRRNPKA